MNNLTEYTTFEEAWEAATTTKDRFAGFQMGSKLKIMREYAVRFFVNKDKEFCYVSESRDGLLTYKRAEVISMIHNGAFYMVDEKNGFLKMNYSNEGVTREEAVTRSINHGTIFMH